MLEKLTEAEAEALLYDWEGVWARPAQLPPPEAWSTWLFIGGRGTGKTRSGAEWARHKAYTMPGSRGALIGPTAADVRDTMILGESGLLAVCPPWFYPLYQPSKRRVVWPNGSMATCYSAEEPDRLNGPQHHWAWADEIGVWQRAQATWDMAMFGLRLGDNPQVAATTTPKPSALVRALVAQAKEPNSPTVVTHGTTYDNLAFLADSFLTQVVARYEGTRLGRQELRGELLDDVPGALWTREELDSHRIARAALPDLVRVVVAIDPAVSTGEDADETGIVVAAKGVDGEGYVLGDYTGRQLTPHQWATRAVNAYREHEADLIVGEVNNGGEMVEAVLRGVDRSLPYKAVHASRGKRVRAEPISGLYEQGRCHHVGTFDALEDQMCNFVPDSLDGSPDRVDALVWAFTELMLEPEQGGFFIGRA